MKAQVLGYVRVQKYREGEYELWMRCQRSDVAIRIAHSLALETAERLRNEINNLLSEVNNTESRPVENTAPLARRQPDYPVDPDSE